MKFNFEDPQTFSSCYWQFHYEPAITKPLIQVPVEQLGNKHLHQLQNRYTQIHQLRADKPV